MKAFKYFKNVLVNMKKRDIKKSSDKYWKTYFVKKFDDQKLVTESFDKTIKV